MAVIIEGNGGDKRVKWRCKTDKDTDMASELKKKLAQCERQQQLWAFRPLSKETLQSFLKWVSSLS
jgi:hypothetical protein